MTEFAAALNKQHQDEIEAMARAGRVDALEKKAAKMDEIVVRMSLDATQFKAELAVLQKQVDKLKVSMEDVGAIWNAAAAAPGTLPPAPGQYRPHRLKRAYGLPTRLAMAFTERLETHLGKEFEVDWRTIYSR